MNVTFTFGEIIGESWGLYRSGFVKVFLLMLLTTLPAAIVQVFLVDASFDFNGIYETLFALTRDNAAAEGAQDLYPLLGRLLLYYGLTLLLDSVSLAVEAGLVVLAGSRHGVLHVGHPLRGKDISFGDLFETVFRSFPKLWITMFFVKLITVIGLFLFFVPAVFFYYVFIFAGFSVELKMLYGRKAMFVSSVCTRKFPKAAAIYAAFHFFAGNLGLSFAVSGIMTLVSSAGLSGIALSIIQVAVLCLRQLCLLFIISIGVTLFIKMAPAVDPVLKQVGLENGKNS